MNKPNIPYSIVTEGALTYFKEDVPLWAILLLTRIHHFNSRRQEKYTLYLEKESMKLRVRPEDIIKFLDKFSYSGELTVDKANAGLYLIVMNENFLKNFDFFC